MTPPAASAAPSIAVPRARPARAPSVGRTAVPAIVRPRPRSRPAPRRRAAERPLPAPSSSLLARLLRLCDHRLLDRLIRGRLWIGMLAFALIGIVAMQLAVLSLNRSIGRSLQRVAQLQRENPALSIENSMALAGESIEPQAIARGMQIASTGAAKYLPATPHELTRAAQILSSASDVVASASSTAAAQPAGAGAGTSQTAAAEATAATQPPSASPGEREASAAQPVSGSAEAPATAPSASESSAPTVSAPAGSESAAATSGQATTAVAAGGGTQAGP